MVQQRDNRGVIVGIKYIPKVDVRVKGYYVL